MSLAHRGGAAPAHLDAVVARRVVGRGEHRAGGVESSRRRSTRGRWRPTRCRRPCTPWLTHPVDEGGDQLDSPMAACRGPRSSGPSAWVLVDQHPLAKAAPMRRHPAASIWSGTRPPDVVGLEDRIEVGHQWSSDGHKQQAQQRRAMEGRVEAQIAWHRFSSSTPLRCDLARRTVGRIVVAERRRSRWGRS